MPVLRDLSTLVGWKIYSPFCVRFHSCSAYSFQVRFSWFQVKFPLMHTQISSQPKSWGNPFCRSQALSLCSFLSALQIWPFLASLNSVLCRLNSARLLDSVWFPLPIAVAWNLSPGSQMKNCETHRIYFPSLMYHLLSSVWKLMV